MKRIEFFDGHDSSTTPTDGVVDPDAIHNNIDGEIVNIDEKTSPVSNDKILIEDSEDDDSKKSVKLSNIPISTETQTAIDNTNTALTNHESDTSTHGVTEILGKDESAVMSNKSTSDNFTVGADLTVTGDLTVNGTTTTINTATLDVEDSNITVNKNGTQSTANTNKAGLTIEMSDATDSVLGYDSTKSSLWAIDSKEILTSDSSTTITNKDIDGTTMSNTNRLALPKGTTAELDALTDKEALFAYDTTLGSPVANDGTGWSEISGGGGGGVGDASIYKLVNFDDDKLSDWDATNLTNATFVEETTSPLSGDTSGKLTNHASAAGEYVISESYTVPLRSRGKTHAIKIEHTYDAGTNGAVEVEAYDVTNSKVLATLVINGTSRSTSGIILCSVPDSCLLIQVRPTIVTGEAIDFIIDDLEFSDSAFGEASLEIKENILYNGYTSNSGGYIKLTSKDTDTSSELIESDNTGAYTYIRFKKRANFYVDAAVRATSSAVIAIEWRDSSDVQKYEPQHGTDLRQTIGISGVAEAGDTIRLYSSQAAQHYTMLSVTASSVADHVLVASETGSQIIRYDGYTSTDGSGFVKLKTRQYNLDGDGNDKAEFIADDNATYTKLTAVQPSYFNIDASLYLSELTSNYEVRRYNSSDALQETRLFHHGANVDSNKDTAIGISPEFRMDSGDYVLIWTGDVPTDNATGTTFIVKATPLKSQTTVALPTSEIQTFSARIANNGTASVTSVDHDFIESVTRSALGNVDIVWKAGIFTVAPTVVANVEGEALTDGNRSAEPNVITPIGCQITTWADSSGGVDDRKFTIVVKKQGADAKAPGVFVGNFRPKQLAYIDVDATYFGGSTGGTTSYKTRTLSGTSGDNIGLTVATNQATFKAGTYDISVPITSTGNTGWQDLLFYDVTNTANKVEVLHAAYSVSDDGITYGRVDFTVTFTADTVTDFRTKSSNASGNEYIGRISIERRQ